MLKERAYLKAEAKNYIRQVFPHAPYWHMVLAGLVMFFCNGGNQSRVEIKENGFHVGFAAGEDINALVYTVGLFAALLALAVALCILIFLINPLAYGVKSYFRHLKTEGSQLERIVSGFKGTDYMHIVKTLLKKNLLIVLYMFLLIVPGVIKAYEFYFVEQLIEEHPELQTDEILAMAKNMTMGHKMDLFVYDLSWIGWLILSALLLGIPSILFVTPYNCLTTGLMFNDYVENELDRLA